MNVSIFRHRTHIAGWLQISIPLEKILQQAVAMGVSRVSLSTAPENLLAQHVYEKVGFRATGMRDGDEDVYQILLLEK